MNVTSLIIQAVILLLFITLSAFFSGAETALFSLSRARLLSYRNEQAKRRQAIVRLLETYQKTLITLILGNMFVNIGISLINSSIITGMGLNPALTAAISVIVAVLLLLLLGEITPKTIALLHSEYISDLVALPLLYFRRAATPLTWLASRFFNFVLDLLGRKHNTPLNSEEYSSFLELASAGGAFNPDEMELLHKVFDLREKTVAELMTPRIEIITINKKSTPTQIKQAVMSRKQQFLPIIKRDIDDAIHLLSLRNFFWLSAPERETWNKSECVFPVEFIPMQCSLTQALQTMRQKEVPAMLAVDEFGRTVGIINQESIYEELVGELEDEYDSPCLEVRQTGEGVWIVSGTMPVFLLEELTEQEIPDEYRANTINGLFSGILGRIPLLGDEITICGVKIRAEAIRRHCVKRVRIERLATITPPGDNNGGEI